ncbi:SdpI family protein [Archaeoglobus fulgidus]|jgi:uncharacterized membrane protein|uniref:Tryptophan-specific permease, putative n=3 Tax=Archaeoglobus fulgidus TaxID=2234 RepID=O28081_ARCFU|nr:SdpI family protein [Archaeoglobus fulgidus]AAB89050.1 tryptophan-specific permease, putative [Archaeoglobus fulgidus DSM 4304]AIG99190.1 putative integral membrane protein [Archaeoglobus fulgidus DSM 8774]KUJ93320.1 MAG: Tryptophan-specific permease, putative [Archaeoglobus fulgidus]KUK07335.1 MAG: Tryptophan-specific permease, putative [Archaeoglobus fulgidus]
MEDLKTFLSFLLIIIGLLTYALRNRPNPYVGVRMGYTYLSKEAWRKANTFAGIFCVMAGLVLIAMNMLLNLPDQVFLIVFLIIIVAVAFLSYRVGKEAYEKEDLRMPAKAKKQLEPVKVERHLLIQLISLAAYLILLLALWNNLPKSIATHFDITGRPDSYTDKFTGAVLLPLLTMSIMPLMTLIISKEPMLTRFPTKGVKALTLVHLLIVALMALRLFYNAGIPDKF